MRRKMIIVYILLFFLLEGSLFPWIVPAGWQDRVIPHFVVVIVLYLAVFTNRHYALMLGLLFGMLHDIVYYGHMIGVYSFSMGLTGYLAGLLFQRSRANVILMMTIVGIYLLFFDSTVFGIYRVFKVVDSPYSWAVVNYILPSTIINLLFALLMYVPLRKLLEGAEYGREKEEDD